MGSDQGHPRVGASADASAAEAGPDGQADRVRERERDGELLWPDRAIVWVMGKGLVWSAALMGDIGVVAFTWEQLRQVSFVDAVGVGDTL